MIKADSYITKHMLINSSFVYRYRLLALLVIETVLDIIKIIKNE